MLTLWVALGGSMGAAARYVIGVALRAPSPAFPTATLFVNLAGSLVLGWLAAQWLKPGGLDARAYALLGTGFCGGFTTFSTFGLETLTLLQAQRLGWALGYVLASVLGGVVLAWVGYRLGR